ncbi:S1C family serine protease [Actinoplanes sp. CA-131856]
MAVTDVEVLGPFGSESGRQTEPGGTVPPPDRPTPAEPRRRIWPGAGRRLLVAAVVVWMAVITALVLFRDGEEPTAAPPSPMPGPSSSATGLTTAQLYESVLPSVVSIISTGRGGTSANAQSMTESASGTGVIANADGSILTANHVVEGAASIEVTYADGTTARATVAETDPRRDIATLTPAGRPGTLVPAALGGGAQIGDPVVAIGNPLGLTMSTTTGVVSGLERTMARDRGGDIAGLIQFDAAVNPGSSGGPLFDSNGQVIGIVVALANPTEAGTFIGIGFAVPIGAALGGGGDGEGPGSGPPM